MFARGMDLDEVDTVVEVDTVAEESLLEAMCDVEAVAQYHDSDRSEQQEVGRLAEGHHLTPQVLVHKASCTNSMRSLVLQLQLESLTEDMKVGHNSQAVERIRSAADEKACNDLDNGEVGNCRIRKGAQVAPLRDCIDVYSVALDEWLEAEHGTAVRREAFSSSPSQWMLLV